MKTDNIIGIIGGMGPHASLDLADKILELTPAQSDHDHLPVAHLSYPGHIVDRSSFLFNEIETNPAEALADVARRLEQAGAVVAGMPCNTAHAPPIFDRVVELLRMTGHDLRLVHMIEETAFHLREDLPDVQQVGTLSTRAVYELGLYRDALHRAGLQVVSPGDEVINDLVNPTIFDPGYGIKAKSHPVTERARRDLLEAIHYLEDQGADAVILGCTELPLAVPEKRVGSVHLVDPTEVLARALIKATHPEVLTPTFSSRPQAAA